MTGRKKRRRRSASGRESKSPRPAQKLQPQSKQAAVIALLRRAEGATLRDMMRVTGWRKHSVHGFLSAVIRRKLGLRLVSNTFGEARVYRVLDRPGAKLDPGQQD